MENGMSIFISTEKIERAEAGGISCLKNDLRQPLQEGQTVREL
jgi:hypothetical protein